LAAGGPTAKRNARAARSVVCNVVVGSDANDGDRQTGRAALAENDGRRTVCDRIQRDDIDSRIVEPVTTTTFSILKRLWNRGGRPTA